MTDTLLNPAQQRILACLLAASLLAVSLVGLWLCRRLRRAYERLDRRQTEETEIVLAHPDYRQAPTHHSDEPDRALLRRGER